MKNVLQPFHIIADRLGDAAWPGSGGLVTPAGYTSPPSSAKNPTQIRTAYGLTSLVGDGAGQTIAIVDAYDNPKFVSSNLADGSLNPAFASSDLYKFTDYYGLPQFGGPGQPTFTKVNQSGGTTYPAVDNGWAMEIALDVEWVHAIAPKANIVLVEAASAYTNDLIQTAVAYAAHRADVSVVSMSFGVSEYNGSFTYLDSVFTTPSGHTPVTFVASTGDNGSTDGFSSNYVEYPSSSPNVVAVGGTSLYLSGGNYSSETAWSGSGGGQSRYESKPSYQNSVNTSIYRQTPDVALVADPNTGVAVYDSQNGGTAPWYQIGGTSLSAPCWGGLVAIANQYRTAANLSTLNGRSDALPKIYSLATSNYHDITSGSNGGYSAAVGYDLVTGWGTSVANTLVPNLSAATPTPDLTVVKSHSGYFLPGQTGATYSITVTNMGTAASSGTVSLTDTLPAGLTATAFSGTGWTVNLATLTATRSDALAAGASYPALTLTVNVASSASGTLTSTATVSGGGDVHTTNNTDSDPTLVIGAAIYSANMDTDPGWTYQGQWAWGQPTGSGGDPSSGYTGNTVVGYNLGGAYANRINTTYYATTPAINCAGRTGVTLSFWRWLGVQTSSYDHASIQVSNNGTSWTTIWQNPSSDSIDTSWSLQTYDISAIADNETTVYVRWGMGTTSRSTAYFGWNLDDVTLTGTVPSPPVVTDANISISGATGTGGAFKRGDTVTATWNNTAGGDNNSGITSVTVNFGQFGGGSAVPATNTSGTWTASYTIAAGTIDATNRNVSVTATNSAGSTTTADTTNATVDNKTPTVTDVRISITSTGSGTGGVYRPGDTLTVLWDNTAAGDNNPDVVSATVNFSQFGGGSAVTAANSAGVWTASYTITAGILDATNRTVSLTATDDAGNVTTTADSTNLSLDNQPPVVTDANLRITSTGTGPGGVYRVGDTVMVRWDDTAGGDHNADVTDVTVDFSQFGGPSAAPAANSSGVWTATYTIVAGSFSATGRNVAITVDDDAGNTTTQADTSNLAVDNQPPVVTDANLSISGTGTGAGGIYRVGDTVTAQWDNTAGGDNNIDIAAVTVDFSQFGGPGAVLAMEIGGIWTAEYLILAGTDDATGRNTVLSATDNAGNLTTAADTTNLSVDNQPPAVTDEHLTIISTGSDTGGVYRAGDTVVLQWDNTAGGDNNQDVVTATADFGSFGGPSDVAATESGGIWTAGYTIVSDSLNASGLNVSLTATDDGGNATTTADTTGLSVDNTPLVVVMPDSAPEPRTTPVDQIVIEFSKPVSDFTLANLRLTRNGGEDLLTPAQTLTTSDNLTWTLGNLEGPTAYAGHYDLTLADVVDAVGNPATGTTETTWLTINGNIVGTSGDDVIRLVRNSSDSTMVDVFINSVEPLYSVPLSAVSSWTVAGDAGDDELTLDGATLLADQDDPISAGTALTVTNGGVLDLAGHSVSLRSVTVVDGSLLNGTVDAGAYVIQTAVLTAHLGGSASLEKTGSGTAIFSASNSFTQGLAVTEGLMEVYDADAIPPGSDFFIGSNGTVVLSSNMSAAATASVASSSHAAASVAAVAIATDAAATAPPAGVSTLPTLKSPIGPSRARAAAHDMAIQTAMRQLNLGKTAQFWYLPQLDSAGPEERDASSAVDQALAALLFVADWR